MGAVADAVESVAGEVVDVFESAGKVVKKTADRVGSAAESVFKEVEKAAEVIVDFAKPALENYVIQVALMAAGIPPVYAAPMAAAGGTLARGGTPEDALKSAAVSVTGTKINQSVYDAAIKSGYSTAQAAAAASAASSAAQTAIVGGKPEDIFKAAAIGAASSGAASEVLAATNDSRLANFTRAATAGVLQGQSVEQAVLGGASTVAVQTMKEYFDEYTKINESDEAKKLLDRRDRQTELYLKFANQYESNREKYNLLVDEYNEYVANKQKIPAALVKEMKILKGKMDEDLVNVTRNAERLGKFNQQLYELYKPLEPILNKVNEAGVDFGDLDTYALSEVEKQEQELLNLISEAERGLGEFRPDQLLALDPTQVASLDGASIEFGPRTLYETADGRLRIDENLVVYEDGIATTQLSPEEYDTFALEYDLPQRGMEGAPGEQLPVTGLVDLRDATGGRASGVVLIGTGGGEGEGGIGGGAPGGTGDFTLPFALIGQDAEGNDKMVVGDQTFTLVTIGNQKVLKNDFSDVYFLPEVGPTENTPIKLTPVDVQVDEQNQPQVVPKVQPTIGGAQGGQPSQEVFERVTAPAAQISKQIQERQNEVRDLLLQGQILQDQMQRIQGERQQIAQRQQELERLRESAISPASVEQANSAIAKINEQIRIVDTVEQQLNAEAASIANQVRDAEIAIDQAEKQAAEKQKEIEKFAQERRDLVTQAQQKRYQEELEEFDRDLERLEREVSVASGEAEAAKAQRDFISSQKRRLERTGRLSGTLGQQLDRELRNFIQEYERASGAVSVAEQERRGLTRPSESEATSRGISDAEIMRLLGLSKAEADRLGFSFVQEEPGAPAEGEGEGAGEVGVGAGGEGEGVGTGEGGEVGAGTGEGVLPDRGVMSTVRIGGERRRPEEGVSTRVTGQGLVGILGDRDPLFGGDPGEQQDVWNVRSLRLRKALGL